MDYQLKKYSIIASTPNKKRLYNVNTFLPSLGVSYIGLHDSRLMLAELGCVGNRKTD